MTDWKKLSLFLHLRQRLLSNAELAFTREQLICFNSHNLTLLFVAFPAWGPLRLTLTERFSLISYMLWNWAWPVCSLTRQTISCNCRHAFLYPCFMHQRIHVITISHHPHVSVLIAFLEHSRRHSSRYLEKNPSGISIALLVLLNRPFRPPTGRRLVSTDALFSLTFSKINFTTGAVADFPKYVYYKTTFSISSFASPAYSKSTCPLQFITSCDTTTI